MVQFNHNSKVYRQMAFCLLVFIFTNCSKTYKKIDDVVLEANKEEILKHSDAFILATKEYKNGTRMGHFEFGDQAVHILNGLNLKTNIDSVEKNMNVYDENNERIEKWSGEFDDLTLTTHDIKEMIKNNVPIVQMTFHWHDLASLNGNNGWETYIIFYPDCKIIDNKFVLGDGCFTENPVPLRLYPQPNDYSSKYFEKWSKIPDIQNEKLYYGQKLMIFKDYVEKVKKLNFE